MPTGSGATWSLAAVGDAIITRRLAQFDTDRDAGFEQMANVIRDADVAFLNLEISLFRLSEFKGWPEVETGGNWELGPPEAAADLKALGFDLFNRANNHTTDYGVEGMRATSRLLDELGLVHAGAGETLGDASRPAYFETPKGTSRSLGWPRPSRRCHGPARRGPTCAAGRGSTRCASSASIKRTRRRSSHCERPQRNSADARRPIQRHRFAS